MRALLTAATLLLVTTPAVADSAAIDRGLIDALKDVHNRAAVLHNRGDSGGGYRTFQGGLVVARALLDHHRDLQTAIDADLARAEQLASADAGCRTLHATIERVRNQLKERQPKPTSPIAPAAFTPSAIPPMGPPSIADPPLPPPTLVPMPVVPDVPPTVPTLDPPTPRPPVIPSFTAPAGGTTLWQRLGGEAGVEKLVADWVAACQADPRVNLTRGGSAPLDAARVAGLQRKLVGFVSAVGEGTVPYTGRSLGEAHATLAIQESEFDAMVDQLKAALARATVPAADAAALVARIAATKPEIVRPR